MFVNLHCQAYTAALTQVISCAIEGNGSPQPGGLRAGDDLGERGLGWPSLVVAFHRAPSRSSGHHTVHRPAVVDAHAVPSVSPLPKSAGPQTLIASLRPLEGLLACVVQDQQL